MSASQPAALGPPSPVPVLGRRGGAGRRSERGALAGRLTLRGLALGYLALLLVAPVGMIFYRTFEHGLDAVWNAVSASGAQHALWLSLEIAWRWQVTNRYRTRHLTPARASD